eukprot:2823902-Prymnesium_polylepis.1
MVAPHKPVFFCLATGEKLGVIRTAEEQALSVLRKVVQSELAPAVKSAFPTGWPGCPVLTFARKYWDKGGCLHTSGRC